MSEHRIEVTVNGQRVAATVEARLSFGDFLRGNAGCTGVHLGCEHGVCGACTVIVDGAAVRSCHPVQQAMRDCHGLQCGFCTPGVLMTMAALSPDQGPADEEQLLAAMSGHICRCTGYQGIRRAVRQLAGKNDGVAA